MYIEFIDKFLIFFFILLRSLHILVFHAPMMSSPHDIWYVPPNGLSIFIAFDCNAYYKIQIATISSTLELHCQNLKLVTAERICCVDPWKLKHIRCNVISGWLIWSDCISISQHKITEVDKVSLSSYSIYFCLSPTITIIVV